MSGSSGPSTAAGHIIGTTPDSVLCVVADDELLSGAPLLLSLPPLLSPVLVPAPVLLESAEPLDSGAIVSSLELSSVVTVMVELAVDEDPPLDDSLPSPAIVSSPPHPKPVPIPSAINQAFRSKRYTPAAYAKRVGHYTAADRACT
jgi:hypothetical protein